MDNALASQLNALDSVPGSLRNSINLRRINFLPEGLETVISDNDSGVALIRAVVTEGLSTERIAGQVTTGTV